MRSNTISVNLLRAMIMILLGVLLSSCTPPAAEGTRGGNGTGEQMEKYDDADWHYGGDFPEDVPEQAGATHMGMFVAWAWSAGLAGEEWPSMRENWQSEVEHLESTCSTN